MSKEVSFDKIYLEWEGSAPIFDDVERVALQSVEALEARVYLSMRKTDLQDMISRFSTALGFSVGLQASSNVCAKGILAFCIVALLNPFLISNEIQPSESSLPGVGHRPPQPPRVGWAARADQSAD